MIVKIDIRETALLHQILNQTATIPAFNNIQIKSETLPIGDIIINDGIEDKVIIERKSINDLLSSIKDGRYEEQSYRLNGLDHHNHNIVYLIEGDVNKINYFKTVNPVEKLTLYSAMFSLNYYKGFSVFRSFNMEETATIVCNMAYKIERELTKSSYYKNKTQQNTLINESVDDKNYVGVIKKVKKENITSDNIGEIMLCQIPGISSVTALAIIEKYGSIANLIKELDTNEETMQDLSYTNAKGQIRKINKTSIANIVKFLLKK
jgi:ERCC4-type nuclease